MEENYDSVEETLKDYRSRNIAVVYWKRMERESMLYANDFEKRENAIRKSVSDLWKLVDEEKKKESQHV